MNNTFRKSTMITMKGGKQELDNDAIVSIFHCLPFRYLLPCKCLNKQFLTLISDPEFFHPRLSHHQLSPNERNKRFFLFNFLSGSNIYDSMLFCIDSNNKTNILNGSHFFPRSWPHERDRVKVKATHHDLILCSTHDHSFTNYFVCNPFTKECVDLPPIVRSHERELARVGFMCDETRSRFCVVHVPIICFEYVTSFQVNMFSSETGKWSASEVGVPEVPYHRILMSNTCSKSILVNNGKFIWWIKGYGFLVCDPFNPRYSKWKLKPVHTPYHRVEGDRNYDIYEGICNGQFCCCVFGKRNMEAEVYKIGNLEEENWATQVFFLRDGILNNMNLVGFHPDCEYMMYLYSKKGIFLCDCKNVKMESVYAPEEEDENLRAWGDVMTLVLPEWPTRVPTWNADKQPRK